MTDTRDTVGTLELEFQRHEIEKRQDFRTKRELDYVSYPAIVRRLNEAFGHKWSFEIVETQVYKEWGEVAVRVRLTADGVVKESWGGETLYANKRNYDGGVGIDNALKGAQSYALRKCASYFGVGLHLWEKGTRKHDHLENTRESQHQPQVVNNGPITQKQMSMIHAIAGKLGMPKEYLDTMVQESDKYPDADRVSELDKVSASAIIKWLDGKQKEAG